MGDAETEEFHLGAEVRSSDGKEVGKLVHVLVGPDYELRVVARAESASPAAGSLTVHLQEQEELLDQVFSGLQ